MKDAAADDDGWHSSWRCDTNTPFYSIDSLIASRKQSDASFSPTDSPAAMSDEGSYLNHVQADSKETIQGFSPVEILNSIAKFHSMVFQLDAEINKDLMTSLLEIPNVLRKTWDASVFELIRVIGILSQKIIYYPHHWTILAILSVLMRYVEICEEEVLVVVDDERPRMVSRRGSVESLNFSVDLDAISYEFGTKTIGMEEQHPEDLINSTVKSFTFALSNGIFCVVDKNYESPPYPEMAKYCIDTAFKILKGVERLTTTQHNDGCRPHVSSTAAEIASILLASGFSTAPPPPPPSSSSASLGISKALISYLSTLDLSPKPAHLRIVESIRDILETSYGTRGCLFGSSVNGFFTPHSDFDISVDITGLKCFSDVKGGLKRQGFFVKDLLATMNSLEDMEALACLASRVPVLKLNYKNEIKVDITFGNNVAVKNSRLLRNYANHDPRCQLIGVAIKLWATRCKINDAFGGHLSPYAWINLVIFFLQHRPKAALLPNLLLLQKEDSVVTNKVVEVGPGVHLPIGHNAPKVFVSELLTEFFEFYLKKFNFATNAVSIRSSKSSVKTVAYRIKRSHQ